MPGNPYEELRPDPLPGGNAAEVLDDLRRADADDDTDRDK